VLIEPEDDHANVVCDVLTAAGYQIVWLLEGASAIDQIAALHPFAVIMNAQLGDMDGASLIRGLRQHGATSGVKVLVIAEASEMQKDWGAIGADDWLMQPVRPDVLLQKVLMLV
jgi:two-component system, sensor histidine kinase and response regulator